MNSMICPYCGNLIAYNSYFDAFYCPKCGGFFKQATVVECNDLNEPLTLDDAIAHLDDTLSDTGHKWSCESCRMEHVQLRAWLAELREIKQERTPADVAPVRHGRWIEPSRLYYGAKQYECSLCYSDTFWKKHSITEKYPHCPNCGATMNLED